MAKKKRASKKKQPNSRKAKPREKKPKEPPVVHQTTGKVIQRFAIFLFFTTGTFYLLLNQAVGGNAPWKVIVLSLLPFLYLVLRRQAFQAPGFFGLIQPTVSRVGLGLGAFAVANGLCWLLFRFVMLGRPSDDLFIPVLNGAFFVLSPVFAFIVKLKVTSWASFMALGTSFQLFLAFVSLVYFYGCVSVVQLEANHLPASKKPLYMLPV